MIQIYGLSDDLVYVNLHDEDEHELQCCGYDARIEIGDEEGGVIVEMTYGDYGLWAAKLVQINDGVKCPWSVGVTFNKYSAVVKVDAPIGTPVRMLKREAVEESDKDEEWIDEEDGEDGIDED